MNGASPGLVGHVSEPVDAVHQHGAKERRRFACPGHLHWLNRGAASEPESGSEGSSSCVSTCAGPMGGWSEVGELVAIYNSTRATTCRGVILGAPCSPEETSRERVCNASLPLKAGLCASIINTTRTTRVCTYPVHRIAGLPNLPKDIGCALCLPPTTP